MKRHVKVSWFYNYDFKNQKIRATGTPHQIHTYLGSRVISLVEIEQFI